MAGIAGCLLLSIMASVLPAPIRDSLAAAIRASVMVPFIRLQGGSERWRTAWLELHSVGTERDSLALRSTDAAGLRIENDQLRKLLGLGGRLHWGFVPADALQQPGDPRGVVTTLTLTAGARAGIARYNPVVVPEGIIGMVQTVDRTTSTAILLPHPDFRVSVTAADGSASGIIYPHLTGSGADRYLLEMRYVPSRTPLRPGMEIVSSGLGGPFPRGITVGTVLSSVKTADSWSRTYLVRPSVDPATVTAVMIMSPRRASQGIGNVWSSAADSAARGLAAAADSTARRTAQIEAARRRAARLDSLRADSARRDSAARGGG
jgi:rod shape-determining protein MreC